ncbi:hypothetical protein [Limnobacter sp. UBA3528]|jgi:hypothetical protein|uniref:hypothetical protein n=1 Tax=Limnobacter sp. UBA3528 TaxID=1946760 RepID=UPI000C386089|nr:hypothetical protein [Limnobacter sp. UBA3528]MAZ10699.1 hypothetical protein [Sutterellaceae bacterium]|tara:strand:- start:7567 stop:7809 length:243 start_codon:yes stop_codon:yes gene_type:complete
MASYAYVSEMAIGLRDISDSEARQIEDLMFLPAGRLDRSNIDVLQMDVLDFELYCQLKSLSVCSKESLLKFLSDMKSNYS